LGFHDAESAANANGPLFQQEQGLFISGMHRPYGDHPLESAVI
jgi:hypothetical protein